MCIGLAACAPGEQAVPTRRLTPTRGLTRPARVSSLPTKVARKAPTETRIPTRTPRPSRTPVPTETLTPTRENTARAQNTRASTAQAAISESGKSVVPATLEPTATAVPPTAAPTEERPSALLRGDTMACDATSGSDYGVLGAGGWEGRQPDLHPDLNLAVRGYREVDAFRGLVDYDGETDGNAPQLWGLFADRRTPDIANTYQVYDWDWGSDSRGDLIEDFEVTMTGFRTAEGETIYTPDFGLELGEGYVALVLYADTHRITLKYTGEDNVIEGYTLHLEGLCVYTNLINAYNARNAAGRGALPALRPGQPIGYTPATEVGVAIRDRGAFLDPRSRKDWWQGR